MNEFGEAFGTAAEGGLFARAIGKDKGGTGDRAPTAKGHFAEDTCLNCGTTLAGPHCHECGQKAHLHRTLAAFMHDLLHGALHFEGKTWKTLPMLVARPGELTRRYIAGERARFVSPMALFLFSIFLMFAVFQAVGLTAPSDINSRDGVQAGLIELKQDAETRRDRMLADIAKLPANSPDRAEAESNLAEANEDLKGLEDAGRVVTGGKALSKVTEVDTGIHWLDKGLRKWRNNPGLMLYKLQSNSYKFSWLLIPLSVPFMWLLFFWKRRFKAYDHAIFVTYSIAFMSLLFIVLSLLNKAGVGSSWIATLGTMIPGLHIYKQLRGAYGLSRFSATWRLCLLIVFISIVLVLFLQLILMLGAF